MVSELVPKVADPAFKAMLVPPASATPLSKKLTVPVGVGDAGVTVAVKVTGAPGLAGGPELVSVVIVAMPGVGANARPRKTSLLGAVAKVDMEKELPVSTILMIELPPALVELGAVVVA